MVFFFGFLSDSFAADQIWQEDGENGQALDIPLPSFRPAIEKLAGAVVNISIEGEAEPLFQLQNPGDKGKKKGQAPSPFDLFQIPPELQQKREFYSLGSGFVINPDGYIVTNNHVIEKAKKIVVAFKDDKKKYDAKVIGSDPKTDIALLKVEAGKKLDSVIFGDSDKLEPGDWVLAIGNPFRLGHTATVGIVSAKSRRFPGGGPYDDFIQTDASINPGNSGGPLFDAHGEVIGVNTAIFSPGRAGSYGFNIGIGFAIPINIIKDVVSQLYAKGKVTRGWLGVLIQPVTPDAAEALGLGEARGALVAEVMDGSPAKEAGIQRRDVIVSFNGKDVSENDDLPLMVAKTPIGKSVPVEVMRQGKKKDFSVTVKELQEKKEEEVAEEPTPDEESKLGLTVQEITPDIASSLGLNGTQGVLVGNVTPDSPGADSGIQRGDVILEVGATPITSVEDFRRATKNIEKNKPILLLVRRDDNTIFLTLKIE